MPKLNLKPDTRNQLALIGLLLDKAQKAFSTLDDVDAEQVFQFHHPDASLTHTLRWGPQAVEELLKASKPKNVTNRKFYRKIYVFDTVSEESLDGAYLSTAMNNADNEGNVGVADEDIGEVRLTGQEAAQLLYEMGSEPGFFQLSDEGKATNE